MEYLSNNELGLEILRILDRGIPNKERIWLRAKWRIIPPFYAIMKSVYKEEDDFYQPTNPIYFLNHVFEIEKGDYAFVYTGKGQNEVKEIDTDIKGHLIYLNLENTLFGNENDCVTLFLLNGHIHSKKGI